MPFNKKPKLILEGYLISIIFISFFKKFIIVIIITPTQAESLLYSLEPAACCIGLHVNVDKTEYMCFNQWGDIYTLKGGPLKLVNKFTYLRSSVSSTENINTRLAKAWTALDRLSFM